MELGQREDHGADHDPEGDPALDGDGGETPGEPLDRSGPALGGRVDELPGRSRAGAREGSGGGLLEEVGHTRPVISPDMFASHHRP